MYHDVGVSCRRICVSYTGGNTDKLPWKQPDPGIVECVFYWGVYCQVLNKILVRLS